MRFNDAVLISSLLTTFTFPAFAEEFPKPTGLNRSELNEFNHLSEGSEVIPYDWLVVLKSQRFGNSFLQGLDRKFGMLPAEPDSPFLIGWQGLSAAWSSKVATGTDAKESKGDAFRLDAREPLRDVKGNPSIKMVGLSCAACHSHALEMNDPYGRKVSYPLPGAGGFFDPLAFFSDLARSSLALAANERELRAFIRRFADPRTAIESAKEISSEFRRSFQTQTGIDPLLAGASTPSFRLAQGRAAALEAFSKLLRVTYGISAEKSITELQARLGSMLDLGLPRAQRVTPPGRGRLDALGVGRNASRRELPRDNNAPVSIPPIWGIQFMSMLNYDANMNAVVIRNVNQAMASGGVVVNEQFDATADLRNLDRLEKLAYKIPPAQWERVFQNDTRMEVKPALVAAGRTIYQQKCATCHEAQRRVGPRGLLYDYSLFPATRIGTSIFTAQNPVRPFQPVQPNGQPVLDPSGRPVVLPFQSVVLRGSTAITDRFVARNRISPQEREKWEESSLHGKSFYRDTFNGFNDPSLGENHFGKIEPGRTYKARHLSGAWATAPYLHNGSVPTLWDLLQDHNSRPKKFRLIGREFDRKNVGIVYEQLRNCAGPQRDSGECIDTTDITSGNSNLGHSGEEFGTLMSDDDKRALIEYLKVLEPEPEYAWPPRL